MNKRELLAELHYWQMRVRQDAKSLKSTVRKCKEVAARLREIQKAHPRGHRRKS